MATKSEKTAEAGGFKKFALAVVATCCVGLAIGFFLADFLSLKGPTHTESVPIKPAEVTDAAHAPKEGGEQPADPGAVAADEVPKGPLEVVQLPPIITNIADPSKVWVRLEGNLLFDKSREGNPALVSARLAQHVMAYLRTLKLSDLQHEGAMYAVSEDLNEIVKSLSDGEVQGLLLSGLVFE